ncbi:MAG: hypothetical protein DA405_00470 [Bacteroidetes bacterium]|nr:MAG: hypothetical protein DA405_00470 [Bacteroidota bacterium]
MKKLSLPQNNIAQALILVVAACTIFWQYPQLQFTHDELSALHRTEFSNFSELIEKGVLIEGHPAGVQTFLYYYAPLVNYSQWGLKLPFSLLALASILLVFAIAKTINQVEAGIYTGAIMAVSQYFIYYGQIIRPYEVGLFFCLLSAWFWMRYFYQEAHFKYLIGFAFAAAGAAYTHQFALLVVAIMGAHALFIARGRSLVQWVFCGLLTFLLYLPHLGIFFHQLSLGGVGSWLGKPSNTFILEYGAYLFHFSYLFTAAVLIALALPPWKIKKPLHWQGIIWFGATFLIGFIYSRAVNPVIQYSTLIFAAPLLLLSLFALRQMRLHWLSLLLILSSGIYSLYADRQHYPLTYQSTFKYPREYLSEQGLDDSALILKLDKEKWDFYAQLDAYESAENYHYQNPQELIKYLQDVPSKEIVLASDHTAPLFLGSLIESYGFRLMRKEDHLGFSLEHFSRKSELRENSLQETALFGIGICTSEKEYCGQIKLALEKNDLRGKQDFILSQFDVDLAQAETQAQLIIAFFANDELIHWSNQSLADFQSDTSFTVFHAQVIPTEWGEATQIEARSFLETRGKKIRITKASLRLMEGNNRIYGINEPFD